MPDFLSPDGVSGQQAGAFPPAIPRIAPPSSPTTSPETTPPPQQAYLQEEEVEPADAQQIPPEGRQARSAVASDQTQTTDQSAAVPPSVASAESSQEAAAEAEKAHFRSLLRLVLALVIGVLLIAGIWFFRPRAKHEEPVPGNGEAVTAPEIAQPAAPAPVQPFWQSVAEVFPQRFPYVFLGPPPIVEGNVLSRLLTRCFSLDEHLPWASKVFSGLGLKPAAVARVIVGCNALRQPLMMLIELTPDQNGEELQVLGEPGEIIAELPIRRIGGPEGSIAFTVLDTNHVLVGDEAALREVIKSAKASPNPPGQKGVIASFQETLGPTGGALLLRLPLAAGASPNWWFDPWPKVRDAWKKLWERNSTAAVLLTSNGKKLSCSLMWRYPDEEGAKTAAAAVQTLQGQLKPWLQENAALLRDIAQKIAQADSAPPKAPQEVEPLWSEATKALLTPPSVAGSQATWSISWPGLDAATVPLLEQICVEIWRKYGAEALLARNKALGASLPAFVAQQGRFPSAAVGGGLLPPETRLSWISEVLPFVGHEDWKTALQEGYSWDSPQNQSVTTRYLPEVVNPIIGPTQTRQGFYDTHFVGICGVGKDAGELPPSDPRAGVFNYRYPIKAADVKDGLSHTMAIMGVERNLGPWAAGGRPSARPLTQPPYVGGPDGFGARNPAGMPVVMADGSVRWMSRDVDPRVAEQLATIAGGEPVTADVLQSPTEVGTAQPSSVVPQTPQAPAPPAPTPQGTPPAQTPSDKPLIALPPPAVISSPCGLAPPDQKPLAGTGLQTHVAKLQLKAPLALAVALLTEWSNTPISVDPESARWKRLSGAKVVQLDVNQATLADALEQLATQSGLTVQPCGTGMVLVLPERLQPSVKLSVWQAGSGAVLPAGETLPVISQWMVQLFPELKDVPIRLGSEDTKVNYEGPFAFAIIYRDLFESRWGPAESDPAELDTGEAGETVVNLNFYEPVPLLSAILAINREAKLNLLCDWPSLAADKISAESSITISVTGKPPADALAQLAEAINAEVYTLRPNTFLLSGRGRLNWPILRAYPIGDLLTRGKNVATLRDAIVKECTPGRWSQTGQGAKILYDVNWQVLIVLHDAHGQAEVSQWLSRQRAGQSSQNSN